MALAAALGLAATVAGCGGSSGSAPASQAQPAGSSIAIDFARHLAFVPNGTDTNGYGIVTIVNLAANPDKTDPIKGTITLSHQDAPVSTLYYAKKDWLLVASGSNGAGGYLDVFNLKTKQPVTGSPFSYSSGSEPGYLGQMGLLSGKLFGEPGHDFVLLSICDSATCSSGNSGTGYEAFDLNLSGALGTGMANYPEFTATNPDTGLTVDASDDDAAGQIGIFNGVTGDGCVLTDSNLEDDNDSAALDTGTNIAVVSDEGGDVTVLNLDGGTFAAGSPCTFTEAGTTPNSVKLTGFDPNGYLEGGIVNPKTHQALLVGDGTPAVTLISLPKKAVAQLDSSMLSSVSSTMPDDPSGSTWSPFSAPSWIAVDPSTNKAYSVGNGFLAQIDLAKLAKDPTSISSPLPTTSACGSSYGVTGTTAACSNAGKAVVFYPLNK